MDPMTQRRMRDDRVYGALCHAGIFLGWWGIATTAGIWALRKDWSRSLRLTGVQAIAFQVLAQIVFVVLAVAACGSASLGQLAELLDTGGIFSLLANEATHALAFTKLGVGCVAALFMLLCLVGFEPSYPVIGFFSRLVLGIKAPKRPEEQQAKEQPKEQKAEEKKPDETLPAKPAAFAPRPPAFAPRPPAPAPRPDERPVLKPLPKSVPQQETTDGGLPPV